MQHSIKRKDQTTTQDTVAHIKVAVLTLTETKDP